MNRIFCLFSCWWIVAATPALSAQEVEVEVTDVVEVEVAESDDVESKVDGTHVTEVKVGPWFSGRIVVLAADGDRSEIKLEADGLDSAELKKTLKALPEEARRSVEEILSGDGEMPFRLDLRNGSEAAVEIEGALSDLPEKIRQRVADSMGEIEDGISVGRGFSIDSEGKVKEFRFGDDIMRFTQDGLNVVPDEVRRHVMKALRHRFSTRSGQKEEKLSADDSEVHVVPQPADEVESDQQPKTNQGNRLEKKLDLILSRLETLENEVAKLKDE